MTADANSNIAWHRVQLKKNRAMLKALETAQFRTGHIASSDRRSQEAIADLKCKIAESVRCIADYEKRTKRPLGTDVRTLASMSWSSWNNHPTRRH